MSVLGSLRGAYRGLIRGVAGGFRWFASALSDLRHPTAWLKDWAAGGTSTVSGRHVSPSSAMSMSVYYDCLRVIAEDVGKLPLNVYRRLEPRGKELLRNHPAQKLLHDSSNPLMSAMTFRETLTHWALGWGNGYAEIVRDGSDRPGALWPIHPDRVTPEYDDEGRWGYTVRTSNIRDDGRREAFRLPPRRMLHIHGLGDGFVGYSVADLARETIGMGLAAQDFGAAFFGNDTTLGIVFVSEHKLSDIARTNLKESLQANQGRASEAFKFMLLEEGVKPTRIGIPPKDVQFLETRSFQVVEVCRWFRMPPHKVAHLENATFSNIEHQSIEYVTDTLMPWLVRWEQEIGRKLFSPDRRDIYARHVVQALLRGDFATRTTGFDKAIKSGWMSPNDVRELEDLNPIESEGGDEYYMQGAMTTLEKIVEPDPEPAPMPPMLPGAPPPPEEDEDEDDTAARFYPIVFDAAERCVRRELNAAKGPARKHAEHPHAFREWARGFYRGHRSYIESAIAPVFQAANGGSGARLTVWLNDWEQAAQSAAPALHGEPVMPADEIARQLCGLLED